MFSDTLALSDQDFVSLDDDKLKNADSTLSLRGRNLVEANLARADLRKVDFSGANLTNAVLRSARLQGAIFSQPSKQSIGGKPTYSDAANLENANLDFAQMKGAEFRNADMRHVKLSNAELEGARLDSAKLQGATIANTNLTKANLRYADLTGASVSDSDLSRSDMSGANLTGALVSGGHLQFATFDKAVVVAAAFVDVNVRGMSDKEVGWKTTLAKGLKGIEEDSQVQKVEPGFETAGLAAAAADGAGAKTAAEADPSLKASEIMSVAVAPFPAKPAQSDEEAWRNRKELLIKEICEDKETGLDIFKRIVFMPGIKADPALQFGPFKSDAAEQLADESSCANSKLLKQEFPGLLEHWLDPQGQKKDGKSAVYP